MKKLLLAFAILGFVACGEGEKTETTDSTSVTAPTETPAGDSTAVQTDSSAVKTDSTAAKTDSAK